MKIFEVGLDYSCKLAWLDLRRRYGRGRCPQSPRVLKQRRVHANQIRVGRLEKTMKVKEGKDNEGGKREERLKVVVFDFKAAAKSKARKVQRGSHPGKPPRPRQDYSKCMETSPFQGQDIKYKQIQVAVRKFLRTSSSIQGFTLSQGLNKFIR